MTAPSIKIDDLTDLSFANVLFTGQPPDNSVRNLVLLTAHTMIMAELIKAGMDINKNRSFVTTHLDPEICRLAACRNQTPQEIKALTFYQEMRHQIDTATGPIPIPSARVIRSAATFHHQPQ